MKAVSTTYANKKEIWATPDGGTAFPVTVDDTGISANAEGKKIVPAGTVVGGSTKPVLLNLDEPVTKKNTASTYATAKIVFGVPVVDDTITVGSVTYTYKDPADAALNQFKTVDNLVALLNQNPAVSAAKNEAGTEINLTAKAIGTAGNSIALSNAGTGTTTVTEFAGGAKGSGVDAEGILLSDVDVTYGKAPGEMAVMGVINESNLPETPVAEAKAAMRGLIFRKQ